MDAIQSSRFRARVEIIVGYAVAAVGGLVGFINWASVGGLRLSSNYDVQSIAALFAYVASVAAWFFLTQMRVDNAGSQRSLLRKALWGLALEQLCVAVSVLAVVVNARDFGWSDLGLTLLGAGALLSALGFYSMLLTYRNGFAGRVATDPTSP
ncbi:MAG: hypothetical protein WCA31_06110 [Acidimicrobiales bacterium]